MFYRPSRSLLQVNAQYSHVVLGQTRLSHVRDHPSTCPACVYSLFTFFTSKTYNLLRGQLRLWDRDGTKPWDTTSNRITIHQLRVRRKVKEKRYPASSQSCDFGRGRTNNPIIRARSCFRKFGSDRETLSISYFAIKQTRWTRGCGLVHG